MKRFWIVFIMLMLALVVAMQISSAMGLFSPDGKQAVCPVNAITMFGGKAVIDSTKCIGCRRCVDGFYPVKNQDTVEETVQADLPLPVETVEKEIEPASKTEVQKPASEAPKVTKPKVAKNYHKVNKDECIGCGLCVKDCPVNAISMVNGKAVIDKNKCINCGICAGSQEEVFAGCPVGAITAVRDSL